jgi:hypothetical protein
MNHDRLFLVKHLIDDAIITHAELIDSSELSRQGFGSEGIEVRGQPRDALDDPTSNRLIQPCQLTRRRRQEADMLHGDYSTRSRRTTSSSDSPRCPPTTACFWRKSLSRTDFLMGNPSSGSPSHAQSFCSMMVSIISLSSLFVI